VIKPSVIQARSALAALALTASTLVGIALHEGYKEQAYIPVPGDVPTIGFGTTAGVRMGDRTTPERSLVRLLGEVEDIYAAGVKSCVTAPLYPERYAEACARIEAFKYGPGRKVLPGLVKRRAEERAICEGKKSNPPSLALSGTRTRQNERL
jgi:lysozyme